jgi:hypothetical protein
VKIVVQIPNHWYIATESFWARRIRAGVYELQNIPFFAYDLNLGDVVRAKAPDRDSLPEIHAVVKRSGNRTLRVIFAKGTRKRARDKALKQLGARYEGFNDRYFALSVEGEHHDEVEKALKKLKRDKVLTYETCEARAKGSFDDKPKRRTRRR